MKGDDVVESFLNYGLRIVPRLLVREDLSSRGNCRNGLVLARKETRLRGYGISAAAVIPAGTRSEPAGL